MSIIKKIKEIIKNPCSIVHYLGCKGYLKWMPDDLYIKLIYRANIRNKLNLENPITFNEKLQWLKINDRNTLYTKLADKYEVREYVKERIGEEYLIPLLGIYDNFDDIDFDSLPTQFVLKTTHDSGGVVICKDKSKFEIKKARQKINKSLDRNYYYTGREWQYKNIKPRIICEKYMIDENDNILKDYKFYCFNGEIKCILVVSEREKNTKLDFFDENFKIMPFNKFGYENSNSDINKPENLEEMMNIVRALSKGMIHVRIDLYEDKGKIFFGEFTFHDFSGIKKFEPEQYDELFGNWIDLSKVK